MIDGQLYDEMCGEFFPLFKKLLGSNEYAITLGGSHGKGIADINSDFDFRIYYRKCVGDEERKLIMADVKELVGIWKKKGVTVDGVWARSIDDINKLLDSWFSGNGELIPLSWSVWGYNILTDIYNQQIVEDPFNIAKQWKERLLVYPEAVKTSIIEKHGSSLRYWRADYHYMNKVKREDGIFLASLSARLINDIVQVIYALNEFYYPGDGMNLKYTQRFSAKPENFEERVMSILYPGNADGFYQKQYDDMIKLIDDTLTLI